VQRHTWGVVGSLVIMLLQIFSWFWQWKNFENRLIFDKVEGFNKNCAIFSPTLYIQITIQIPQDKRPLCSTMIISTATLGRYPEVHGKNPGQFLSAVLKVPGDQSGHPYIIWYGLIVTGIVETDESLREISAGSRAPPLFPTECMTWYEMRQFATPASSMLMLNQVLSVVVLLQSFKRLLRILDVHDRRRGRYSHTVSTAFSRGKFQQVSNQLTSDSKRPNLLKKKQRYNNKWSELYKQSMIFNNNPFSHLTF